MMFGFVKWVVVVLCASSVAWGARLVGASPTGTASPEATATYGVKWLMWQR